MPLTPGTRLGPYEILSSLGVGGMGEVYKARDTRLDRVVAVKVLPEHVAPRNEIRARFEREARTVASLNHPHICTLYDIGNNEGAGYMVMELIEGETLAARIAAGALPLEQALKFAVQIADALDRAHRAGVTHRDIKPQNIMLSRDGVKILDFGLARSNPQPRSSAETLTAPLTVEGTVMGTPLYMAPEQLQGMPADARSDIWAFTLVLYEMVSGRKAFHGKNYASLVSAILGAEPEPLTHFQPLASPALSHLIETCLAKDPDDRLQNIRDVLLHLRWIEEGLVQPLRAAPPSPSLGKRIWIAATALACLLASGLGFLFLTRLPPSAPVVRFSFAPPFNSDSLDVAVSPDGRRIAFSGGASGIWLRSVDAFVSEKLSGTNLAIRPFWSADGRSIGFFGRGLGRVDVDNRQSPVHALVPGIDSLASPWSPDGVVLYPLERTGTGLSRVPAGGGVPTPVTELNAGRQEITHRYPRFLPDGRHFIYWVWSAEESNTGIYVGSLDPNDKLPDGPLVRTWREALFAEPGYLLFLRDSRLMAQRFDLAQLRLTGSPHSFPDLVGTALSLTGQAMYSVSAGGVLAYQESVPQPAARLAWRDRDGKLLRSISAPLGTRANYHLSVDPSEKRAVLTTDDENTLEDLWVVDLERGTSLRLTSTHGSSCDGLWSPDGHRIVFRSNRSGRYDLYGKDADGAGAEERLVKSAHYKIATSWSPDGRFLVYTAGDSQFRSDIWISPLDGDRKPFPFLRSEFNEGGGKLSPVPDSQGHLAMAYISNETGRSEVYVRPFLSDAPGAPAGPRLRVSTGGSGPPQWRKDGRELFYPAIQNGKRVLMAVDVKLGSTPEIGSPHSLFELPSGGVNWVPLADGRRFLFIEPDGQPPTPRINVVLNWTAELAKE